MKNLRFILLECNLFLRFCKKPTIAEDIKHFISTLNIHSLEHIAVIPVIQRSGWFIYFIFCFDETCCFQDESTFLTFARAQILKSKQIGLVMAHRLRIPFGFEFLEQQNLHYFHSLTDVLALIDRQQEAPSFNQRYFPMFFGLYRFQLAKRYYKALRSKNFVFGNGYQQGVYDDFFD